MEKQLLLALFAFITWSCLNAQVSLVNEPITGGVTSTSAKIYFSTNEEAIVNLNIKSAENEIQVVEIDVKATSNFHNNSAVENLEANTLHTYWISNLDGEIISTENSFTTFPVEGETGNYSFTFSACDKFITDSDGNYINTIYSEIAKHNPSLFIHLGDWSYPDRTDDLPDNPDFFSNDYSRVEASYQFKYSSPFFKELASKTPIDYVYDDHDYVNNNASKTTVYYSDIQPGNLVYDEIPIPPYSRANSIKGYQAMFPAYELPDTAEGIYHKYTFGNVEFFILDNRSSRSPNTEFLKFENDIWSYEPDSTHTMLGEKQLNWLIDGLSNSKADWKIIGSGTVFNKSYTLYLDSLINFLNADGLDALKPLATEGVTAMIDSWAGFPYDQNKILNHLKDNLIGNVIWISGDAHNGAIDDGRLSGIPEMMAASISQENSGLVALMHSVGIKAWGIGGQGLDNDNDNNVFGKLSTYKNDSLKMELIDEFGTVITSYTLPGCDLMELEFKDKKDSIEAGENNGFVELSSTHSRQPVQYSIDGINYQDSGLFENLAIGDYTIFAKDAKNCKTSISFSILEKDMTAIPQWVNDINLLVYPNPVKNKLTISLNEIAYLAVYQLNGSFIFEQELKSSTTNTINMEQLPAGVFLLKIKTMEGESTFKKIMKQ